MKNYWVIRIFSFSFKIYLILIVLLRDSGKALWKISQFYPLHSHHSQTSDSHIEGDSYSEDRDRQTVRHVKLPWSESSILFHLGQYCLFWFDAFLQSLRLMDSSSLSTGVARDWTLHLLHDQPGLYPWTMFFPPIIVELMKLLSTELDLRFI